MKKMVELTEEDIMQIIANSFCIDKKNVEIRHFKESKGYGLNEHDASAIKAIVQLPMNDMR